MRDWDDLEAGARPASWREAVRRWRDYIRDKEGSAAVFENLAGDRVEGGRPHRFHPEYADTQYAKLKDLERGLRAEYGRRLHTAMLTLTASSAPDGDPQAPVDHLDALDGSWEAVRRSLSRVLEGRRWEYLAILEPHQSGYLHVHMAVFVDGVVTDETFRPVIEAHLRNCEQAGDDAHQLEDDSTVSVKRVGERGEEEIGNLGTYLAEYLGTYGDDPLDAPEHQQMGNALLWATGKQRWRPSNGAQRYMARERSEGPTEWELVAIRDGNGDLHEVAETGGGVATFTTGWDPPD